MDHYKYLIIGGGVAAGYAARTFAEHRPSDECQLGILSSGKELPFERPALSKGFLAGEETAETILINEPEFYSRHGIDVHLETTVEDIDFEGQKVRSDSDWIGYDNLLIATGARAKRLPIKGFDLTGIHTLRALDDSRDIQTDMQDAETAVVIGGSFIGMEVGSVLQRQGIQTTLVFPEERVWEAFFAPEMSSFFETYYRDRGVQFAKSVGIERFHGSDGRVSHVELDSGQSLPADMAVAGVGVKPNVAIAHGGPLHVDDGILINRFLETNIRDVFAAGDVARYRDPRTKKLRRIEHWDNAKSQGQHAARGMLGMRDEFHHVPYFFSDVFDLSYEFWGDTDAAKHVLYRGNVDEGSFSTWWLDGENRLVAAFVMGRPEEERDLAPEWIRSRVQLDPELIQSGDSLSGAEPALQTQA